MCDSHQHQGTPSALPSPSLPATPDPVSFSSPGAMGTPVVGLAAGFGLAAEQGVAVVQSFMDGVVVQQMKVSTRVACLELWLGLMLVSE